MKDSYLFSDVHSLGMYVFSPIQQGVNWHDLFDQEEREVVQNRRLDFIEAIVRCHKNVVERGGVPIMRVWNHLDFVAAPYLAAPSYRLDTTKALEPIFDVRQVFLARHPLGQWSDYLNDTTVGEHVDEHAFLRGYRAFAEIAAAEGFYRVEDLHKDPEAMLRAICDDLDLQFDPEYENSWFLNTNVTGDPVTRLLASRMYEEMAPPHPAKMPRAVIESMRASTDYHAVLELLGYDDDYPIDWESAGPAASTAETASERSAIDEIAPPHPID